MTLNPALGDRDVEVLVGWPGCCRDRNSVLRRAWATMLAAAGALILQACTTTSLARLCVGSDPAGADADSLGVILGVLPNHLIEAPFIVFRRPSQEQPVADLHLKLTRAPIPWPNDLNEAPCRGLDWTTFRVTTDPDQWIKFWDSPRPMGVEIGVGILDSIVSLRTTALAFAVVDTTSDRVIMSCGCYWT